MMPMMMHAWEMKLMYYMLLQESSCQYWPVEGEMAQFGEFKVDLINQEELNGFTVRILDIILNKLAYTKLCLN